MNESVQVFQIHDQDFQKKVIECTVPIVVVFEKTFWGTAHIMKPVLEKLHQVMPTKLKFTNII